MGLGLGGSTEYYVNSFAVPLAKGEEKDDSLLQSILTAHYTDKSTTHGVVNWIFSSLSVKGGSWYNYGKKANGYIHGLPEGSVLSPPADRPAVQAVFDNAYPTRNPVVKDLVLSVITPIALAKHYLFYNEGYVMETNLVTLTIPDPAYPDDPFPPDRECTLISAAFKNSYVEATLEYKDYLPDYGDGGEDYKLVLYKYINIPLPTSYTALYYIGTVVFTAPELTPKQPFIYNTEDNTYPSLTPAPPAVDNNFYPIAPIRYNYTDIYRDDNLESKEVKSTSSLLRTIGLDLKVITDEIHGTEEEPNLDLDKLIAATILFASPIVTVNKGAMEYNFEFFKKLGKSSTLTRVGYDTEIAANKAASNEDYYVSLNPVSRDEFVIKEQNYNTEISYSFIEVLQAEGQMYADIKVGEFHMVNTPRGLVEGGVNFSYSTGTKIPEGEVIYGKQIGTNTFEYVLVYGLMVATTIPTGGGDKVTALYIKVPTEEDEEVGDNMVIPVNIAIIEAMNGTAQNLALTASIHLVVYAVTVVELKWYQTSFFQWIVMLVALVLAVVSGGQSLQAAAVYFVLLGASTTLAIVLAVALLVVASIAIKYVMKWAIKQFGIGGGLLATLVIAIVYAYVSGDASAIMDLFSVSVENALAVVNAVLSTINVYIAVESEQLSREMASWTQTRDEQQEELDELDDLIKGDSLLDPMFITTVQVFYNEKPEEFYGRTLNTNPGVQLLKLHENYVDIMLELPEYKGTLPYLPDTALSEAGLIV